MLKYTVDFIYQVHGHCSLLSMVTGTPHFTSIGDSSILNVNPSPHHQLYPHSHHELVSGC